MNKHIKRSAAVLAAAVIGACSVTTAFALWDKDADGNWRWTENGQSATGWEKINDKWYYFSPSGQMQTGWLKDNGKWYFLNGSGDMATGWRMVNGKWYYLDGSGSMATGWRMVNGEWYYLDGSGSMATGWRTVNGKRYFLNTNGAMATNWLTVDDTRYFLDDSGAMQTGVIAIDGDIYYFDENGAMATSPTEINGKTYKFGSDGKATGRKPTPDKSFGEKKPSTGGGSSSGGGSSGGNNSGNTGGNTSDNTGSSTDVIQPPATDENPIKSAISTTRTEETAAQIRFTAEEPGYFYCYIPELHGTSTAAARAQTTTPPPRTTLSLETITNKGMQFGVKEGENVISLTGLVDGTSYTMYTAVENLYQEVTVFDRISVSKTVDPESAVAETDKNVVIDSVAPASGQITVRLNKALDTALTKENFHIYCPAGSDMTIISVETTDKQNYVLHTSYYRDNTYFMEITLPGGKVLQKYFQGRFDCPEITDPSAERISDTQAKLTFASDQAGKLYYLAVPKTVARSSNMPTEDQLKQATSAAVQPMLNTVTISSLTAGTAYDLYYLVEDETGKTSTPVLGPTAISAETVSSASAVMESCAAISDDKFTVTFDKAVPGLTLDNFALNCPRGSLKLGGATPSDGGKTYTVSLRQYSMFKEKVNYTVSVTLADGSVVKGIFYTDLYGPMLTGIDAKRYTDGTAGVTCTSDRPGFIYCLPSENKYDPNGDRPTVTEVVNNGTKLDLNAGSNLLKLADILQEHQTVWYVTENKTGFRLNYVDHFNLPTDAIDPPGEGETDPDADYIISAISGNKTHLVVSGKNTTGSDIIPIMEADGIIVQGTTVEGTPVYKSGHTYWQVSWEDTSPDYYLDTHGGWELEPGDYTLTWTYEGDSEINGATVSFKFTIGADGNVVQK